MKKYHPGSLLVPVTRASGSRQDLTVEGAPAVYWNRHYYLEFLKQSLDTVDNILHTNNRRELGHKNDGEFHTLSDEVKHSMLATVLKFF